MSQLEYITKTLNERVSLMLQDDRIMAEYQSKQNEAEAKDWIQHQALMTLMYSPEEREEMAKSKNA